MATDKAEKRLLSREAFIERANDSVMETADGVRFVVRVVGDQVEIDSEFRLTDAQRSELQRRIAASNAAGPEVGVTREELVRNRPRF